MKLLKTILGTTLITLGCAATSNIALAGNHEKMQKHQAQQKFVKGKRTFVCKQGYRLKWQNNKPWCYRAGKPHNSNMQGMKHKNNQQNGVQKYKAVIWKNNNGLRYATCPSGYNAFVRNGNHRCYIKPESGWKPWVANLRPTNGDSKGYTEVEWTLRGGKKYAACPRGYKAFKRQNQYRCYNKRPQGWIDVLSLREGDGGGGMKMQKNTNYDKYRYFNGNNVACRKGKLWYDNAFRAHCGG